MLFYLALALDHDEKIKFEQLYNKYWKILFYYAKSILKTDDLAEEAVQEAFIRILKNLHKISEIDSSETKSFMVTTVWRISLNLYNKQKSENVSDIDDYLEKVPTEHADPTWASYDANTVREDLSRLLKMLPEDYQTLLIYKTLYGWSYRELSEYLNISEKNVSVKLTRARNRLLQLYRIEKGE